MVGGRICMHTRYTLYRVKNQNEEYFSYLLLCYNITDYASRHLVSRAVSVDTEFRSSLLNDLAWTLSWGSSQDVRWSCIHLKASLGCKDVLPRQLNHLIGGWGWLSVGGLCASSQWRNSTHHVDYSIDQLASPRLSDRRTRQKPNGFCGLTLKVTHSHFCNIFSDKQVSLNQCGGEFWECVTTRRSWSLDEAITGWLRQAGRKRNTCVIWEKHDILIVSVQWGSESLKLISD